jgi:hypothetical protein
VHLGSYPGGVEGDRNVEALGKGAHEGGSASMRAATRVKPEQASKSLMRAPSRPDNGEGRRDRSEEPTREDRSALRGIGRSTHADGGGQHGRPAAERRESRKRPGAVGPSQVSEGLIVPRKPVNAGGGKEPWFGVRPDEPRGGRLA